MKTPIIISIGLITIAIALALGYVVFVKTKLGEPIQAPEVNNNTADTAPDNTYAPIPAPDDDNSKIDTADWLTYKNDKYGYEVKYPSNWFIYDYYYNGEKHSENLHIQNFSRPEEGGFSGIGGTGCQLGVWVESEKYVSIQDWIDVQKNNLGKDLEKISTDEIEVGGIKSLEVIFSGNFLGSGDPVIIVLNNRILYKIIEHYQDVPQEKCQPVFDKILSTFKFIN